MWERRYANKKSNIRTKAKLLKPGNGGGIIQPLLYTESENNDKAVQVGTYIQS